MWSGPITPSRIAQTRSFDPDGYGASAAARDSTTTSDPSHRVGVDLAPRRVEPDRRDVRSRIEPLPPDDGVGRVAARAHDVGARERTLVRRRGDGAQRPGELLDTARVAAGDPHLPDGPHAPHRLDVGPGLTPVPITASTAASSRASSRTESAEQAAVRIAVTTSPSITASGAPVTGSKTATMAL